MRRLITLFFLVFTLSGVAFAQQMSDDQVVQYVKSAQQMGKNQKQITTELMRRGVLRGSRTTGSSPTTPLLLDKGTS